MTRSWISRLVVVMAAGRLLLPVAAQIQSGVVTVTQMVGQPSVTPTLTLATITSLGSASTRSTSAPTASVSSSNETSEGPREHSIKVGAGGFILTPDSISNVSIGDTVTFEFFPTGHSIVRAEFGSACVPYEYVNPDKTGFWSGAVMIERPSETRSWSILINSTEPIFFYCGAKTSCNIELMVGVINPNSTQTLSAQKQYARNAQWILNPGDPIPTEGQSTLHNPTPTATVTAAPVASHGGSGLSAGAIAGIVVGGVAFLAICAALFFYIGRAKSLKETINRQDTTAAQQSGGPEMGHSTPGPYAPYGSPDPGQRDYYGNQLPAYGQHNATDTYPSGYPSPGLDNHHLSMISATSGMSQQQMDDMKQQQAMHMGRAELHSPTPGQGDWAHELEAARGPK